MRRGHVQKRDIPTNRFSAEASAEHVSKADFKVLMADDGAGASIRHLRLTERIRSCNGTGVSVPPTAAATIGKLRLAMVSEFSSTSDRPLNDDERTSSLEWVQVATMTLSEGAILVQILDPEISALTECVYAWRTPDLVDLRIGTSAGPIGKRLMLYSRHLNAALQGAKSPAPAWEAEAWRALLVENKQLSAYLHQPPAVRTIAGMVRPFLDIERTLIKAGRPRLNRSHR